MRSFPPYPGIVQKTQKIYTKVVGQLQDVWCSPKWIILCTQKACSSYETGLLRVVSYRRILRIILKLISRFLLRLLHSSSLASRLSCVRFVFYECVSQIYLCSDCAALNSVSSFNWYTAIFDRPRNEVKNTTSVSQCLVLLQEIPEVCMQCFC